MARKSAQSQIEEIRKQTTQNGLVDSLNEHLLANARYACRLIAP